MYRILIDHTGGPDVLRREEIRLDPPGPGALLLRHTAIGLNFIDIYHRTGLYPAALPSGLGYEAAAVVEAVGPGTAGFTPGDRVAYAWGPLGAYASHRLIAADAVVALPSSISDETAAAGLLKAATAEFLAERCAHPQPGDTVLVHAAAGGVGLLLCQWLATRGIRVIGTVGSPDKAALAAAHGCAETILYRSEAVAPRVRALTGGKGVAVVYDAIGRDTFEASLDCLAPRGLLVSFGNASGPVTGVSLGVLGQKGSLYVTRPSMFHYYADPAERAAGCARVFAMLEQGAVKVRIDQRFALADAARAHTALEERQTTGSTILIP